MNNAFFRTPILSRRHLMALAGGTSLAAASGLLPRPVQAAVRVDITSGNAQPISIALPDFVAAAPAETETARGVTSVISNNLQRRGFFAPINPKAYIEKVTNTDAVPRLDDWRTINAQALVTGRITRPGGGRARSEIPLWARITGQPQPRKQ